MTRFAGGSRSPPWRGASDRAWAHRSTARAVDRAPPGIAPCQPTMSPGCRRFLSSSRHAPGGGAARPGLRTVRSMLRLSGLALRGRDAGVCVRVAETGHRDVVTHTARRAALLESMGAKFLRGLFAWFSTGLFTLVVSGPWLPACAQIGRA